jgi:tRNA(fMet)-specific endonuclease VapC
MSAIALIRGLAAASGLPSPDKCALSAVTTGELWLGAEKSKQRDKQLRAVDTFIQFFSELPFDKLAARHYGEIRAHLEREGTPIGPLDQLIAAHARSLNATLITANIREFQRVPDLRCLNWKARARL